jgi:hypothetical protein
MDGVALRALRLTIKFVYNFGVQGRDAGAQSASVPCYPGSPSGGSGRVDGKAVPVADQGLTTVELAYALDGCNIYQLKDDTAAHNFDLHLTGAITEKGALSATSTAQTAVFFDTPDGGTIAFSGTVYDPPITYDESGCEVHIVQNGNDVAGTLCGRDAAFSF